MQTTHHYHLKTTATSFASRALVRAATDIVARSIQDEEAVYLCDLALFEACTNVVKHAYPNGDSGELEINIHLEYRSFCAVEIIDYGVGFSEYPVRIQNAPPEAESGRGLFIISQLANAISIHREGDKNIISFKLEIEEKKWKRCE